MALRQAGHLQLFNKITIILNFPEIGDLKEPRFAHKLVRGPNILMPDGDEENLIALGNVKESEILDRSSNSWLPYFEAPDSAMISNRCFFQAGSPISLIYFVDSR